MIGDCKQNGLAHRAHIKTHKSLYFARRQMEFGALGIACAKLGEAEVMARGGIRDILLAYPLVGNEKLRRLGELMRIADVKVIVNSTAAARGLSQLGERVGPVKVLIDVDGGLERGGVKPREAALAFAREISALPGIEIVGIMFYGGPGDQKLDRDGMIRAAEFDRDELVTTAQLLRNAGLRMEILSEGSTSTSKLPEHLSGATETRAGHYIFNDLGQLTTGMAAEADCALRVHATVVSVVDERRFIIDAGSKTLSSDLCRTREGYGYIVEMPDAVIFKLNEEHGFVRRDAPHGLRVGDPVRVIPNHCCVVMNLANRAIGIRADKFERFIPSDARGENH
jgi:D-serine deaminase-like pyridoxal phosphate-dependent protein